MGASRISLKKHGARLLLVASICAFSSMYAYMSQSRVHPLTIVIPDMDKETPSLNNTPPISEHVYNVPSTSPMFENKNGEEDENDIQRYIDEIRTWEIKQNIGQTEKLPVILPSHNITQGIEQTQKRPVPLYNQTKQTIEEKIEQIAYKTEDYTSNTPVPKANVDNIVIKELPKLAVTDTTSARRRVKLDKSIPEKSIVNERIRIKESTVIGSTSTRDIIEDQHNNKGSSQISVLVLTYMRSGSSLTGNILEIQDDVFYVFEPFKLLYKRHLKSQVSFINGTVRNLKTYPVKQLHAEAMRGWLTCNFSLIGTNIFNDDFMMFGKKTKHIRQCLDQINVHESISKRKEERVKCILELEEQCRRSKFVVVKSIRTRMDLALSEYQNIPNMKIVHLIRDPRATMNSQSHRNVCPVAAGGLLGCAKRHCERVMEDTRAKNKSAVAKARNIFTLKYEDLATSPVITTQALYTFVGLQFNDIVAKIVFNITLGGDRSQCKICQAKWQIGTASDSSAKHVNAWKTGLSAVTISNIAMHCKSVILHYKYTLR